MKKIATVLLTVLAFTVPVFAQTAAAPPAVSTTVDFGPFIVQYVLPALGTILTALIGWAVQQFAKKNNIQMSATMKGMLDDAVTHGLAYAQSRITAAADAGKLSVDTKSAVIKQAADYAMAHAPDAVKAMGYTPAMVAEKVEAHLSFNTTPPEQSAAVPTPPKI